MKQVGELVREAIEATERGAIETAFVSTCAAIEETLKKSLAQTDISSGDYRDFIKRHWRLLTFTGLPRALPLSLKVEFGLTKLIHGFSLRNAEDTVFHIVWQTVVVGHLPVQFKFHQGGAFEIEKDRILVPATLIRGLIGIVIFQPANKGESVPDNYWINISDFKMFVSEFWGRIDLAERIMDFYLS